MKEFAIGKNDAGQRLDRFAAKAVPLLPSTLAQKYIRLKRIKLNGKGAKRDARLSEGDTVQMYVNDEFFAAPNSGNAFLIIASPSVDVVYEDENILIADKRPGIVVHEDESGSPNTLINHIKAYLYQKKEWNPRDENAFAPALCNRIDRNTGGLVIAAKNAEALRIVNQKIRDREIRKYYLCIALGSLEPPGGRLEGFIFKDEVKKQVFVRHRPVPGAKKAVTYYKTLRTRGELSLVECELETGRTHQIRAQLTNAGHPLLGDGKYGDGETNRRYGQERQALYSYKLRFEFTTDAGSLAYLDGREFRAAEVPFEKQYFC